MRQATSNGRRYCGALAGCAAIALCTLCVTRPTAAQDRPRSDAVVNGSNASPLYGITIPPGYRDWKLVSVGRLSAGNLKQVRAQLGNDIAIKAYREGTLPFPDGAIIAALHWNEVASDQNNKVLVSAPSIAAFTDPQSSVAGSAVNVQFMVKDSKKYAATDGWGFADFTNGKPGDEALHKTCYPCHKLGKDRDLVFARYAPTP